MSRTISDLSWFQLPLFRSYTCILFCFQPGKFHIPKYTFICITYIHNSLAISILISYTSHKTPCKFISFLKWSILVEMVYHQISNISGTLMGNIILDHSDVVGVLVPLQLHLHSWHTTWLQWIGQNNWKMRQETFKFWYLVWLFYRFDHIY